MAEEHNLACGEWSEENLAGRILEFKSQRRYESLVSYLEGLLDRPESERIPAFLKVKLYNELGFALLQLDRMDDAKLKYKRSLSIDPKNGTARFNLANMALYVNQFTEAIGLYESLLADEPDHAGALYNMALCNALTGDVERALPVFVRVAEIDPGGMGAHYWAGECLLYGRRYSEALPHFRKALLIDSEHPESRRGAAICFLETGEYRQAIEMCETLLMDSGPELTALRVKGDAHIALGDVENGVRCHLDMAFIDFDAREFLINRAAELAAEQPDKADYYRRRILDHFPDFEPALKGFRAGEPAAGIGFAGL